MKKSLKLTVFSLFAIFAMCIFVKVPTEAATVNFTYGTTSFKISWEKPDVPSYRTFKDYCIENVNGNVIWTGTDYNTNYKVFNPGKGYVGSLYVSYRYYYNGQIYDSYIGSADVNTAPVGMSSKNIGIESVLSYTKKISLVANKPANATGVQFECYKGSKRAWVDNYYSTLYHPFSQNAVYKYRARAYYKNYSSGKTYYGSWSGFKYFSVPSLSGKSKSNQKGFTLSLKRTPGVKYYKVYVAKSQNGKYRKVKTIKLSSKKKYTFRVTKNYKKRAYNYIKVIPYIKVGGKLVKSGVYSTGSIYVWK
ncbi:MAG: hypothetical protein MRZ41_05815 [Eubacterium sp.]|nr:hypothetical protein [Eubacterium sp.]